jgi:hypothetical protein
LLVAALLGGRSGCPAGSTLAGARPGGALHLLELLPGGGQADLQSVDLAQPALAFGLGDAGDQVVADLDQTVTLGGIGSKERAAQAALTELILKGGQPRRRRGCNAVSHKNLGAT